jgi:hypothetical protein
MMKSDVPFEYLRDLSKTSIEAFMMKRLEVAAILRKDIRGDIDKMVQALVDAEVASLILLGKLTVPEKESPQLQEGKSNAA